VKAQESTPDSNIVKALDSLGSYPVKAQDSTPDSKVEFMSSKNEQGDCISSCCIIFSIGLSHSAKKRSLVLEWVGFGE